MTSSEDAPSESMTVKVKESGPNTSPNGVYVATPSLTPPAVSTTVNVKTSSPNAFASGTYVAISPSTTTSPMAPGAARYVSNHGANPSAPIPRSGMTPLHIAASRGDAATTRRLLRHGADPDATDLHGRTPRDWAALRGHHGHFDANPNDTTKGGAS